MQPKKKKQVREFPDLFFALCVFFIGAFRFEKNDRSLPIICFCNCRGAENRKNRSNYLTFLQKKAIIKHKYIANVLILPRYIQK